MQTMRNQVAIVSYKFLEDKMIIILKSVEECYRISRQKRLYEGNLVKWDIFEEWNNEMIFTQTGVQINIDERYVDRGKFSLRRCGLI